MCPHCIGIIVLALGGACTAGRHLYLKLASNDASADKNENRDPETQGQKGPGKEPSVTQGPKEPVVIWGEDGRRREIW